MSLEGHLERLSRGWRGMAVAAFVAFLAGLPGVFAVPPLDRDESRFAQATAQMLETDDYVVIRFQEEPRFKKPVGIHWMQAASVSLLSDEAAREIWAYRIPSLLGAMLAAAACAWGAAAFFGRPGGMIAGSILGASILLSTEAFIAKTDSALCGFTTLAMAALSRIYASTNGGAPVGWPTKLMFWIGVSMAALIKGPVGLMIVGLAMLALWIMDRKAPWARKLSWDWGLILFVAVVGPWSAAVTVATDGGFWLTAIGGDLAPKLVGGHERHWGPPGYHTLLTPFLFFPGSLLLPAALIAGWKYRDEPGVRFALAWVIPTWLAFEIAPTKLVHYTLPGFGGLAWLATAALLAPMGKIGRWGGVIVSVLAGALFAGLIFYLASEYGDPSDVGAAAAAAGLFIAAGGAGAYMLARKAVRGALLTAGALAIVAHGTLAAAFLPRLEPLLLSREVEETLAAQRLLPRQGIAPAPVAVAGYAEPSLVFALGTPTDLGDAGDAAAAIAAGRPAVVESREEAAFQQGLSILRARATLVGRVQGQNYSNGDEMDLRIYAPRSPVR
ncbi:glycosyltransferase family 39 protein, partial [Phenylobacterium sp.]|uniref:ArnT family glycosyltransferase n=1 Tax=Phenylobacterium sp. TaxID=1871053 RepID=UPI002E3161F6